MSHWPFEDRKTYYHIDIPRQLTGSFWRLMAENYELNVIRRQHSPDGKDLSIELRVTKSKKSIVSSESSMNFTEKQKDE